MKVSSFYENEYVDYAAYDNLRKFASVVDGQKNASRKILYTVLEKNIKDEIKVSQLSSKMAEFADYLHGDASGVIVTLAKNYAGTNNVPLLDREGSFGTRFENDASAPRYIFTNGSKEFFELFNKEDNDILVQQTFEGAKIEPMFYVPNLPILLLNGSTGAISSGFKQDILSRNPKKVKQYIKDYLNGNLRPNSKNSLEPYFEGFNGTIKSGEKFKQWHIDGVVKKIGVNKVEISEVPINYDLQKYLNVLDKLEDDNKIQGYRDLSENDIFKFEVTIPSKVLKEKSEDELIIYLKLRKTIMEIYTVIDENNKIKVFGDVKEIIDHYIKIKLEYMQKRKDNNIITLEEKIKFDYSKYIFIKMIVEDKIKISKRKKSEIESDLEKVSEIYTKDENYDYLLNMSIQSLTEERMKKLYEDVQTHKENLDTLIATSIEQLWLKDL